jgi:hypothetical protein
MAEWLRDNDQVQIGPCPCTVQLFEQLARAANGSRPDAIRHDAKAVIIRALVILLTALAPGKVIIERLHARIGEWRGRRDRWRAVGIL